MSLSKQADIADYSFYNSRMDRSIFDKLFFIDKVNDPDLVVDFGCAQGTLLSHLSNWFPDALLVGYDKDEQMVRNVREELGDVENILATQNWEEVQNIKSYDDINSSVMVLSSVLHEVYHYSDTDQIDEFWNKVWGGGFDKIVIRDMIPSSSIDRESSINNVKKVYKSFGGTKELEDFVNEWGSIKNSHKQLVHFLLKYRYTSPNWSREVREQYFPFYFEDLLTEIPHEYSILFKHHYVLPFIKQKIREDFGIELEDPTHLKLILELRE